MRVWMVGQNEAPILGDGWYGRSHDWYGLPYRESLGKCTLRLPAMYPHQRVILVLGSALCQHRPSQSLTVRCDNREWTFELKQQPSGYGWQNVEIDLGDYCSGEGPVEFVLEPQKWRHGDFEEVQDFREVGILLGAVILEESPEK